MATGLLSFAFLLLTVDLLLCISSPQLFTGVVHYTVEGRPPNVGSGKILEVVDGTGNDMTCFKSKVCSCH